MSSNLRRSQADSLVADTLLSKFSTRVTFIDFVVLFVLGLISGLGLGLAISVSRPKEPQAK